MWTLSISQKNKGQNTIFVSTKDGARNFCLGGPSCSTNIFIKITPTHIYTFLFDKLYIYTPKKEKEKKKNLVFSITIMFDVNLS